MQDAIQQVRQAHVASLVSHSSGTELSPIGRPANVYARNLVVPLGHDAQQRRRPRDRPVDRLDPSTHLCKQEQDPGAQQARQGQDSEATGPGCQEPVHGLVARVSDGGKGV
jgi:hypothetical protein